MKLFKLKAVVYLLLLAVGVISCDSEPDNFMSSAKEGGDWLNLNYSSGKLLGTELNDGSVQFTDVELAFEARSHRSNNTVNKYTVKKEVLRDGVQLGVAVLGETTSLTDPFKVAYTTISEYLEGTGMSETELMIGDKFNFFVEMELKDGSTVIASANQSTYNGTFAVTVQCASNLAGTYTRTRDGLQIIIEEISPGNYLHTAIGPWGYDSGAFNSPLGGAQMTFSDVCGILTIEDQTLNLGQYSNYVVQDGDCWVDPNTGVITLVYDVENGYGATDELTPVN